MATQLPKRDRRQFLRDSAFATIGLAGVIGQQSGRASVALQERGARSTAGSKSLSRQFAEWVVRLRYEDLPADVVDRAKGLTLQNISSALLGAQLPAGRQAINFITEEESGITNGATILVTGARVTKRRCGIRELGTDAGRRKVGHVSHADASGHGDYSWCARRCGEPADLGA